MNKFLKVFLSKSEAENFCTLVRGEVETLYSWDVDSDCMIKEYVVKY